jgi:hypothetical protein
MTTNQNLWPAFKGDPRHPRWDGELPSQYLERLAWQYGWLTRKSTQTTARPDQSSATSATTTKGHKHA